MSKIKYSSDLIIAQNEMLFAGENETTVLSYARNDGLVLTVRFLRVSAFI
jgi:hypothetical protein